LGNGEVLKKLNAFSGELEPSPTVLNFRVLQKEGLENNHHQQFLLGLKTSYPFIYSNLLLVLKGQILTETKY
jgi:hypothetical protein